MDAGSIKYTVEAETSDLLMAEKAVDKSTSAMAQDFNKVDKATKKLDTQITKTAKGVKTGMAGMGRGAGQAGIQFQQFIGQVQGGQSVMLALSQQSADLGIVLGAPLLGAIAGISASLIGMLIPALIDSGKSVDELIEKIKEWKKTIGLTKEQAEFLTNEEIKGNKVRAESIASYTKQINIIEKTIKNQEYAIKTFDLDAKAKKKMTDANIASNAELAKAIALRQGETQAILDSGKKIEGYNAAVGKGSDVTKKQKEEVKSLTSTLDSQLISLEQQARALKDGDESAFRWATAQRLGMKEGELFEQSIDDRITAIFKLTEAQKKAADDKKQLDADANQKKADSSAASAFAGGIVSRGMSESEKFAAEGEKLKELRAQALITEAEYEKARTALHDEESTKRAKQEASAQMMMRTAIVGFLSSTTSALLSGMDEQSSAYKAMFAIQKGLAIASTIMNAHVASIAALSPVGGLGPVAGIPLSNTILGLGYASAGIIAGTAIAGGREFGGGVSKGNAYRMGEAGPEILTQGGKNYVIPGENGSVTPNNQMGGGVSIVVNNNAPGVDVQANASEDGKTIEIAVKRAVNEVANQISNNQGQVPRALRQSTNTTMRANR
tara:strand:+ start:17181 stop:19016 length:1836 start_codon:yes stop_codon:yes gene_type:complete